MKNTRSTQLFFMLFLILFINCKFEKNKAKHTSINEVKSTQTTNAIQELFYSKCMICHETQGKAAEEMLAPPFFEIKQRYLKISIDKTDFIETMTHWTQNPTPDNSFMKAAIKKLGVMPKNTYSKKDIQQIVQYIYNTDFPEPLWLKKHRELHEKGIKH